MLVSRTSRVSGKVHTLELNITSEQLDRIEARFGTKELIQDIAPQLTADEREFLMTGITAEEWNGMFNEE